MFEKGKSGNPKGRPKGTRTIAIDIIFEVFAKYQKEFKKEMEKEAQKNIVQFYNNRVSPLQPKNLNLTDDDGNTIVPVQFVVQAQKL